MLLKREVQGQRPQQSAKMLFRISSQLPCRSLNGWRSGQGDKMLFGARSVERSSQRSAEKVVLDFHP